MWRYQIYHTDNYHENLLSFYQSIQDYHDIEISCKKADCICNMYVLLQCFPVTVSSFDRYIQITWFSLINSLAPFVSSVYLNPELSPINGASSSMYMQVVIYWIYAMSLLLVEYSSPYDFIYNGYLIISGVITFLL